MSGEEYGRRTGQHQQRGQQARLGCCDAVAAMAPRPTRIDCAWPFRAEDVDAATAFFLHADRIEIETADTRCEFCGALDRTVESVDLLRSVYSLCAGCREEHRAAIGEERARQDAQGAAEDAAQEEL